MADPIETPIAQLRFIDPRLVASIALGVAAIGLGVFLVRLLRMRRAHGSLIATITATGVDHIQDVLIPDGMGGMLQIDFLLLTSRGILVIDLRDVVGNIFGGDQMTDWTVMDGASRTTFPNPQSALYDRVASVKSLAGNVPVEGRILFTRPGKFPKGLPRWTLMVDSLRTEFPPVDRHGLESWLERYREGWNSVRAAAIPSPLHRPKAIRT